MTLTLLERYYDARERADSIAIEMNDECLEAVESLELLEEENAKLRELVRDAWGSGHPDRSCAECEIRDECHLEQETQRWTRCLFERRIEQRMRELGIEVE